MNGRLRELETALQRSDEILGQARRSGMEVSDSMLRLQDGQEALVKARVAVHGFRGDSLAVPVKEGLAIAAETYNAGQHALHERNQRRLGLVVSMVAILVVIAGLYMMIQRIEGHPKGESA